MNNLEWMRRTFIINMNEQYKDMTQISSLVVKGAVVRLCVDESLVQCQYQYTAFRGKLKRM